MKKKIEIGIVILNYNSYSDTVECIKSIQKNIDTERYFIVVVDNKSPDGSGKLLFSDFKHSTFVKVILNNQNTGFSNGLNIGINYLRTEFDPSFLIVSNSDIKLLDTHLLKHINDEFRHSSFSVLAPMIVTPDGRCDDNPIFDSWYSRENANYDLKYWKHRLFFTKIGLERLYLFNRRHNRIVRSHKQKVYTIRKDRTPGIFLERRENVIAHGCFIIFSNVYFKYFDGLDPRTFMYAEEDVLFVHLLEKKLLSVYQPKVIIYHKGGSSIKTSFKETKKRKIFLYTNYISAIKAYLKLIDELGM